MRILKLFFLFTISIIYSLFIVFPANSTTLAICARTPATCSELATVSNAAALTTVPAAGAIVPYTAGGALAFGGIGAYTAAQIQNIQNIALQKHLIDIAVKWKLVLNGVTQLNNIERRGNNIQECDWYIAYYPQQFAGATCEPMDGTTWNDLSQNQRNTAINNVDVQSEINNVVNAVASQNNNAYSAAASSSYQQGNISYQAGDIAAGDSYFNQGDSFNAVANIAANISGTTPPSSAPPRATPPPTPTPTGTPTSDPVAPPPAKLPPKDFKNSTNFLTYAVTSFSRKFPFDVVYGSPDASQGLPICPDFTLFYHKWTLCVLLPFYSTIRWITFLSLTVKFIMEL